MRWRLRRVREGAAAARRAPRRRCSCRNLQVRFFTERRADHGAAGPRASRSRVGEFLTLLGPSGCGKSTLLRVVADLIAAQRAARFACSARAPEAARLRRDIGFVFQDPALLPWRTALQNVELPLQVAVEPRAPRQGHAARAARAGRA